MFRGNFISIFGVVKPHFFYLKLPFDVRHEYFCYRFRCRGLVKLGNLLQDLRQRQQDSELGGISMYPSGWACSSEDICIQIFTYVFHWMRRTQRNEYIPTRARTANGTPQLLPPTRGAHATHTS